MDKEPSWLAAIDHHTMAAVARVFYIVLDREPQPEELESFFAEYLGILVRDQPLRAVQAAVRKHIGAKNS